MNAITKTNAANSAYINAVINSTKPSHWGYALAMFTGFIILFIVIFTSFSNEIRQGYEYSANMIRTYLGEDVKTDVKAEIVPLHGEVNELTTPPRAVGPQPGPYTESIVERILPVPADNKEVFNVSQNKYTYYDAEPLCKALGAELATYDQVKTAWEKGADWCNYGWVKGQMAVYPTQKGTYDALQNGPADQQGTCGKVGLNGGHFDNPEMQYGVNCFGHKSKQTTPINPQLPETPEVIKFNKKVEQFAHEAESTPIAPFNAGKWSGDP